MSHKRHAKVFPDLMVRQAKELNHPATFARDISDCDVRDQLNAKSPWHISQADAVTDGDLKVCDFRGRHGRSHHDG